MAIAGVVVVVVAVADEIVDAAAAVVADIVVDVVTVIHADTVELVELRFLGLAQGPIRSGSCCNKALHFALEDGRFLEHRQHNWVHMYSIGMD